MTIMSAIREVLKLKGGPSTKAALRNTGWIAAQRFLGNE